MSRKLPVVLRVLRHDADFLRERFGAGQIWRQDFDNALLLVVHKPIRRVMKPRGEVSHLAAAIPRGSHFANEILRRAFAPFDHAGQAKGILKERDAIQPAEVDDTIFLVLGEFEGESNIRRAFKLQGDLADQLTYR